MPKSMLQSGGYIFPGSIDLAKSEIKNPRAQNLASPPSNPVPGQFYFDSSTNPGTLVWWSGSAWVAASGGAPSGAAGGSLTGTYPNPTLAANSVGASQITDGTVTDAEIATANKDGLASVASLRTLGTGAQQAVAGNDSRLTDPRPPTGAAAGSLAGTYPNPTIAAGAVGSTEVANAIKDPAAATAGLRTIGTGPLQAAAGNDARLSDTRTPTAGSVVDASVSATAAIALSKLAVDPRARSTHTGSQTASTISDLATVVQAYRLDQFAAPTGPVGLNGQRLTSAGAAVAGTDVPTLQQVQGLIDTGTNKTAVRGAVPSTDSLSGLAVRDGVTPVAGDRWLVGVDGVAATQNGIYVAASGAWTRATDADISAEVRGGLSVWVNEGTSNKDTRWVLTTDDPIVLGTTTLLFVQDFSARAATAGAGLTAAAGAINVGAGTGIIVAADAISVDTSVVCRRVQALVGNGSATTFVINHGLGNQYVDVSVYEVATGAKVDTGVVCTSTTSATVDMGALTTPPAANSYMVVVVG